MRRHARNSAQMGDNMSKPEWNESVHVFCKQHGAGVLFKRWATKRCSSMEKAWESAPPKWLGWIATRPGILDQRTLRLSDIAWGKSWEKALKTAYENQAKWLRKNARPNFTRSIPRKRG